MAVAAGEPEGDEFAEEGAEEVESYPKPPEEVKLFVGNLAQLFDQAGVVEVAEVKFFISLI